MVSENALESPNAQQNGLRSSREAGKEMRLNKSGKNLNLRLHEVAIHPNLIPEPTHAQAHHALAILGPVLHDAEVFDDAATQHGFQFFRSIVAMGAYGIDQRDVLRRGVFKL